MELLVKIKTSTAHCGSQAVCFLELLVKIKTSTAHCGSQAVVCDSTPKDISAHEAGTSYYKLVQ